MKKYTPPYVDWMQEGAMIESENGIYVKFEDVVEVTNKLVNLMIKPTKLREEFVLEFLEKTEVS